MKKILIIVLAFVLAGCAGSSAQTQSGISEAQETLARFLHLLHEGQYADAVLLYGGEYEAIQVFNPEIDASDHAGLWAWACGNQLLQCLESRSITFKEMSGDAYVFQVQFTNADGSLFVLGPCCGADETEMPPVSDFEFQVTQTESGNFLVMNTPPYVP